MVQHLRSVHDALERWQEGLTELGQLNDQLIRAMGEAADSQGEMPRQLIIEIERKRALVDELFTGCY